MANEITLKELQAASVDAKSLSLFVNADAATQVPRRLADPIETLEYWRNYMSALAKGRDGVDAAITSITVATGAAGTAASVVTGGTPTARTFALTIPRGDKGLDGSFTQKAYTTYAAMDADKVNIPANTSVTVNNDTDATKNGMYAYNGTVFTKSAYDPVAISAVYTDDKISTELDFKSDVQSDYTAFSINDSVGKMAVTVSKDATLNTVAATVSGHRFSNDKKMEAAVAIRDSAGNHSFIANDDGSISIDNLKVRLINNKAAGSQGSDTPIATEKSVKPTGYTAEINGICSYGQSLGMGSTSTPVISDTQNYDNLMFNSGVRTYDGGTDPAVIYASLEPLVESQTNSWGETPISGMADNIKMLISAEDGIDYTNMTYRMLGAAPANSGAPISTLIKGTNYFNRLIDHIKYGALRSAGINSSYAYQATTWLQGEADYSAGMPKKVYKDILGGLVTDIATATKVETNQSFNPEFIIGQVGSHLRYAKSHGITSALKGDIAQAQLEVSIERNDVHLACPSYFSKYSGSGVDQVHLTAEDERVMGAYFGLVYKRVVIDGKEWQPLRPISITRSKRVVYITLNNESALNIDTTFVAANTDYGFRVFDGEVQADITSVSIINKNSIKIVLASDLSGIMTVDYALATDSATGETGRLIGARGNIRDSQGDTIIFDPTGVNRPLHNWLVMFTYNEGLSKWL